MDSEDFTGGGPSPASLESVESEQRTYEATCGARRQLPSFDSFNPNQHIAN